MRGDKRYILSIVWLVIGTPLAICGGMGIVDSYWSGMGFALLVVGILQLIRHIKYRNDSEYREKQESQNNDERVRFISGKAWSWAGYSFVMISAVASILLKLIGLDAYVQVAAGCACLIMLLYWVFYMILSRKY